MVSCRRIPFCHFIPLLFFLLQTPASAVKQSYVVYMGSHAHSHSRDAASLIQTDKVTDSHHEFLGNFLGSKKKAQDAIFYSYTRFINGFAANLEEEEAAAISTAPGVIAVFPNRGRSLHTTRSWGFLGLERDGKVPKDSLWSKARFGEHTIIGNLDTGVWPESASFDDEGMGPVPARWKGTCEGGAHTRHPVRCNRKLIGARYFNQGYKAYAGGGPLNSSFNTPRDDNGHGTHTLSTAGGRPVPGASVFGFGNGTTSGGSPAARVAAYRVCWAPINGSECFDADILAGFEAAIHDGVDVLSVSLGGDAGPFFKDALAIGSFHAVKNGITVVCSAGNSGPTPGSVSNVAPWMITVAASTMDREFPSYAVLGNGTRLKGQSLSPTRLPGNKFYPLISSADAGVANDTQHKARLCHIGSLDPKKVKGKIVACQRGINARVEKGEAVLQAGGYGMILINSPTDANEVIADAHVLPATHLTHSDGLAVFAYINFTKNPVAKITAPRTVVGTKPAPFMAAFSSQGPNTVNPEILKPDITAPGVSVIAAFTQATGPTNQDFDKRRVQFNSISGTSMSCPHIAGIVGLLRTLHPDWSSAAIKSAIMTTATIKDNRGSALVNSSFVKATPFSYGAGHVHPNRAMDPGLVYDMTPTDYLNFLCVIGYNSTVMSNFSMTPYHCPKKPPKIVNLNYPSITIPNLSRRVTVTRTVKNVGSPGIYTVNVRQPAGVTVTVKPRRLVFSKKGEERKFNVTVKAGPGAVAGKYSFGVLSWSDGVHNVRSPLGVRPGTGKHST